MKEKLEQIKTEAIKQIQASDALEKLNDVRVAFLKERGAYGCSKKHEGGCPGGQAKGWAAGK